MNGMYLGIVGAMEHCMLHCTTRIQTIEQIAPSEPGITGDRGKV